MTRSSHSVRNCCQRMLYFQGIIVCLVAIVAFDTATAGWSWDGSPKFALEFYDKIRSTEGNLFFSPLSIQASLALVYVGANGQTSNQMLLAAHLPEKRRYPLRQFAHLLDRVKEDSHNTIHLANAIFVDKQFTMKPYFLGSVQIGFHDEASVVDFEAPEDAAETINNYVAEKTDNKIAGLFDASSFDSMTKLVLLNAIYFKGDWDSPFPESATTQGIFHVSETEEKEVDFMTVTAAMPVVASEELDAQIIELRYQGDLSMIIVLPNNVDGLQDLESKISTIDWGQLMESSSLSKWTITMPKFKMEQTIELNDLLINMGVIDLFAENADLSGIADEPLFASKAVQKAYIEVTEQGDGAAARYGAYSLGDTSPNTIIADHPFLFFIGSKRIILFAGRVQDPQIN